MEGIKLQITQNKLSNVSNHNLSKLQISQILHQTMEDESEQEEEQNLHKTNGYSIFTTSYLK